MEPTIKGVIRMKYLFLLLLIGCGGGAKLEPKFHAGQEVKVISKFYQHCHRFIIFEYQNVFGEYINYKGDIYCGRTGGGGNWTTNVWFREDELSD